MIRAFSKNYCQEGYIQRGMVEGGCRNEDGSIAMHTRSLGICGSNKKIGLLVLVDGCTFTSIVLAERVMMLACWALV